MYPSREGVRGKRAYRQRHAPKRLAQIVAAHPVNVEDVRHFMHDDVFQIVVEIRKPEIIHRWSGIDDDAV